MGDNRCLLFLKRPFMIDLKELERKAPKSNVIVAYKGAITDAIISDLLESSEKNLIRLDLGRKKTKKLFMLLTEGLQNTFNHGVVSGNSKGEDIIAFAAKVEDGIELTLGNFFLNQEVEILQNQLSYIARLSLDQLKETYKEVLSNGKQSEKGGSGLGLLFMAKTTDKNLDYSIIKVDNNLSYLTLVLKIK